MERLFTHALAPGTPPPAVATAAAARMASWVGIRDTFDSLFSHRKFIYHIILTNASWIEAAFTVPRYVGAYYVVLDCESQLQGP